MVSSGRPGEDIAAAIDAAILLLPEARYDGEPSEIEVDLADADDRADASSVAERHIREGSFFVDNARGLMQFIDGAPVAVQIRKGRSAGGYARKARQDHPQADPDPGCRPRGAQIPGQDRPWKEAQLRPRIAWSSFVRDFGQINHTTASVTDDDDSGKVRETHRRPNI